MKKEISSGFCAGYHLLQQHGLSCFQIYHGFFQGEAPAETGERPVLSDDTMAWDDNWDRIFPIGGADCTAGFRVPDPACKFLLTDGVPIWDFLEFFPYFFLEFGPLWRKRKVKVSPFAQCIL